MASLPVILVGGLAAAGGLLFPSLRQRYVTLGVGRPASKVENIHGMEGLKVIPNTIQCEDLHHEKSTNVLFAACQATAYERSQWFPPLTVFTDPKAVAKGTIVRVDPTTFESTVLKLNNGPNEMTTHGIDILNDPDDPTLLWIFVVNHLPDPNHWFVKPPTSQAMEHARIEVFKHVLGSDEADFVRTVMHPLIITPNDLLATSPTSFYVSNDHIYTHGNIRLWEDVGTQYTAPSTTVVHVEFTNFEATPGDDVVHQNATTGVTATVALNKVHNSNGLGHASPLWPEEMNVIDASGGVLTRVKRAVNARESPGLQVLERIQLDATLDNPSWYEDLYATPANNASGYILPGLSNSAALHNDFPHLDRPIPSCVYHVRPEGSFNFEGGNSWDKRLIFQDNGTLLRSASGAVLVGIDPATNDGKKQAWLFTTGFGSHAMVAAKVDL